MLKTLREYDRKGGEKFEEGLRAIAVLLGYWFLARAIIRLLDLTEPAWWVEFVLPLTEQDWEFGVYLVYGLIPAVLAVAAFCIWRPKAHWAKWLIAPVGLLALAAMV
jgi:hypothetical protein